MRNAQEAVLVTLYSRLVSLGKYHLWCFPADLISFTAASLGLPRLLKDADIECEEPADVDDENINEAGFQATPPGEHTKLSSALALFRASKLLAKVLDDLYPTTGSHDLSLGRVAGLSDDLDAWRNALPSHLRLEFTQDTLNVNVTSNRSPILVRYSLRYLY